MWSWRAVLFIFVSSKKYFRNLYAKKRQKIRRAIALIPWRMSPNFPGINIAKTVKIRRETIGTDLINPIISLIEISLR